MAEGGVESRKTREEVSQSDSSHPIFSRGRRIKSARPISYGDSLTSAVHHRIDLLIPTTILTAFVRRGLPGGDDWGRR